MRSSTMPNCEVCGRAMRKILVDIEDDGRLMTAFECQEHQTLAELKTESLAEAAQQGLAVASVESEVTALPDGTLCLPLTEFITSRTRLAPGSRVRLTATDGDYVLVQAA